MIGRLSATIVMLLFAFVAFWDNALGAGSWTNPFGFLFLFLAVVIWFKWAFIQSSFYAAKGDDPIIRTASKVIISSLGFRRHDPPLRRSSSSDR